MNVRNCCEFLNFNAHLFIHETAFTEILLGAWLVSLQGMETKVSALVEYIIEQKPVFKINKTYSMFYGLLLWRKLGGWEV